MTSDHLCLFGPNSPIAVFHPKTLRTNSINDPPPLTCPGSRRCSHSSPLKHWRFPWLIGVASLPATLRDE